jgi:hypothetical protein
MPGKSCYFSQIRFEKPSSSKSRDQEGSQSLLREKRIMASKNKQADNKLQGSGGAQGGRSKGSSKKEQGRKSSGNKKSGT